MLRPETKQDSVICLHPAVEERGRVKSDDSSVFTVSLKDCLACSGCAITEDEITLLAHQDPSRVIAELASKPGFAAIVSTATIANLAAARKMSLSSAFASISQYLTSLGAGKVITDGFWQRVYRKLLISRMADCPKPMIISRCSGAVLFFERRTKYANHLVQIKPFAQLFAIHEKNVQKSSSYVLSLAPCFDRKLETGRFENDVDAVMTIGEIADKLTPVDSEAPLDFPQDNDVVAILKAISGSSEVTQTSAGKITEYTAGEFSGALICGEASLRRFVTSITRGKCKYDIVEADLCPVSCVSGGGLIRGNSPRERKEMVEETRLLHEAAGVEDDAESVAQVVAALQGENISAEYVSVENDSANDLSF